MSLTHSMSQSDPTDYNKKMLIQFCCLQPVISFQAPRNLKVLSLLMETQKIVGNVDLLKLCYMILHMNYVCNGYKMMIDHRKL